MKNSLLEFQIILEFEVDGKFLPANTKKKGSEYQSA